MARPTSPRLSRQAVVGTALTIVDRDGLAALSTRRLASALGVSGPSLYHHFASKEEILAGIVAAIYDEIDLTRSAPDWQGLLAEYAHQLRAQLAAHPHVGEIVLTAPVRSEPQLRVYDHIASALAESGIEAGFARQIIFAVDSVVFGALAMTNAGLFDPDAPHGGDYPALLHMASTTGPPSTEETFTLAVGAFLTGLEAAVVARQPPGPSR